MSSKSVHFLLLSTPNDQTCITVSGLALLLYDALLTSAEEVDYVWMSLFAKTGEPFSRRRLVSKVFYLLVRMAAIIVGAAYLYGMFSINRLSAPRSHSVPLVIFPPENTTNKRVGRICISHRITEFYNCSDFLRQFSALSVSKRQFSCESLIIFVFSIDLIVETISNGEIVFRSAIVPTDV